MDTVCLSIAHYSKDGSSTHTTSHKVSITPTDAELRVLYTDLQDRVDEWAHDLVMQREITTIMERTKHNEEVPF